MAKFTLPGQDDDEQGTSPLKIQNNAAGGGVAGQGSAVAGAPGAAAGGAPGAGAPGSGFINLQQTLDANKSGQTAVANALNQKANQFGNAAQQNINAHQNAYVPVNPDGTVNQPGTDGMLKPQAPPRTGQVGPGTAYGKPTGGTPSLDYGKIAQAQGFANNLKTSAGRQADLQQVYGQGANEYGGGEGSLDALLSGSGGYGGAIGQFGQLGNALSGKGYSGESFGGYVGGVGNNGGVKNSPDALPWTPPPPTEIKPPPVVHVNNTPQTLPPVQDPGPNGQPQPPPKTGPGTIPGWPTPHPNGPWSGTLSSFGSLGKKLLNGY